MKKMKKFDRKRIRKILTKKFLIEEYVNNKKSTMKLGKEIKVCHATIENYLHKFHIKLRTNKESHSGKLNFMYGKRFFGEDNPNFQNGGVTGKIYYCKVCECPVTFMSAIKGLGMCKSCSHKGRLSFTFGKSAPHGKRIKYKGISMRSSWETLFAQFLDLSGIKYKYEPERFYFKDCSYCPDFYLPEFDLYIEIKGYWRPNTRKRFNLFKRNYLNKNIKILMQKDLQELGIQV